MPLVLFSMSGHEVLTICNFVVTLFNLGLSCVRTLVCYPVVQCPLVWLDGIVFRVMLLFHGRICNLPCHVVSFRIFIRRLHDFHYNRDKHSNLGLVSDIKNILQKQNTFTIMDANRKNSYQELGNNIIEVTVTSMRPNWFTRHTHY